MSIKDTPQYKEWMRIMEHYGLWTWDVKPWTYPDTIHETLTGSNNRSPHNSELFAMGLFLLANGVQPREVWHLVNFHPLWHAKRHNRRINSIIRSWREGRFVGYSYWDRIDQKSRTIERAPGQLRANLFIDLRKN